MSQKVAIIAGAGRMNGVGAATAKLLAAQGYDLLLAAFKSDAEIKNVAQNCQSSNEVETYCGDLSDEINCNNLVEIAEKKWGKIDVIVNCVGKTITSPYDLDKIENDDFNKLFKVNVMTAYLLAKSAKALLRISGKGVIVNISSSAGETGIGSSIPYAVTKGAENTLTKALAKSLAPDIRVNAVCPSFIDSSWWDAAFQNEQEKRSSFIEKMKKRNILGNVLKPHDVAQVICGVIENQMMTGELIKVDAGSSLK